MVEMTETAAILRQSTRRSLIVLDEVGRGTSTYDGMAIARAVVEYIHDEPRLRCRTLFATHYHELTALSETMARVKNYHMAAVEQEGQVVFLHELRPGSADRSYGIHVAELAGIPHQVIRRASELLAELEGGASAERSITAPIKTQGVAPAEPEDDTAAEQPALVGRRSSASKRPAPIAHRPDPQPTLFDLAPNPVLEMIRRINLNELTPIEALLKLHELQKLAGRE